MLLCCAAQEFGLVLVVGICFTDEDEDAGRTETANTCDPVRTKNDSDWGWNKIREISPTFRSGTSAVCAATVRVPLPTARETDMTVTWLPLPSSKYIYRP